jgi:DNA-binding CsgD family transcriptional regulator
MQREVLILRFGLLDNQEQSLAQIGEKLNISRERVRQTQQQAMTKTIRNSQFAIANKIGNQFTIGKAHGSCFMPGNPSTALPPQFIDEKKQNM